MGLGDKIKNSTNEALGKAKEGIGDALNNPELEREGEQQQSEARAAKAEHEVHAKAEEAKDAVENKADQVGDDIANAADRAKDKLDRTF